MRSLCGRAAPLVLLGAVGLAGCETDQSSTLEPVGPPVFDFGVGSRAISLPGGTGVRQNNYFLSITASDLGGGADFSNRLVGVAEAPNAIQVSMAASATETSYAFANPGIPGRDGFIGTVTVRVDFLSTGAPTATTFLGASVSRVDATGVVQASSAVVENATGRSVGSNPALLTFTFANLNLGTWAPGDRLRINYRFRNAAASVQVVRILAGPNGFITVPTRSVALTATNLRALQGTAQYQFWVRGDSVTKTDVVRAAYGRVVEFYNKILPDTVDPITGDPVLAGDSTVVSDVPVNAYKGSDDTTVTAVRMIIDSVEDGTAPVAGYAVVVSLENAAATTPGPAQFLWKRTGLSQAPASTAVYFGTYGGADFVTPGLSGAASPLDYVFPTAGTGVGGVRGDEISVDFTALGRPPAGFFYRGFLVAANGEALLVDTLRSAWSADSSLSRVNLLNADVDNLLPGIVNREIRTSQVRNCVSGSGENACQNTLTPTLVPGNDKPFAYYPTFLLMLDPKGSDGAARWRSATAAGALPEKAK